MKTILLLLALLLAGAAQAQTSAADKQALTKQLNELMRDPKKSEQTARITLSGCHVQQVIRDEKADVHPEEPINVSYSKGGSGAGFSLSEGVFEMKFDFDWADVAAVTYEKESDGPTSNSTSSAAGTAAPPASTTPSTRPRKPPSATWCAAWNWCGRVVSNY